MDKRHVYLLEIKTYKKTIRSKFQTSTHHRKKLINPISLETIQPRLTNLYKITKIDPSTEYVGEE